MSAERVTAGIGIVLGFGLACAGGSTTPVAPVAPTVPVAPVVPAEPPAPSFEQALAEATVTRNATFEAKLSESDGLACSTSFSVKTLAPASAGATSALAEGDLRHDAARALDDQASTAWVEGVDGDGVGEGLFFLFADGNELYGLHRPDGLTIIPGYAKDERRWSGNNRVSSLLVRWLKPREGLPEKAPSQWQRDDLVYTETAGLRVDLASVDGKIPFGERQYVDFLGYWEQNMEETETVGLEVLIVSVDDQGAEHDDTCVSELQLAYKDKELAFRCAPGWCENNPNVKKGCER